MAQLATAPDPDRVRRNLAEVRAEIAAVAARREVRVLAAVKYTDVAGVGALAEGGVTLAGENRAQALAEKAAAHPELEWHFIGHLQSRKVDAVAPLVRMIHSVASDSVVARLERLAGENVAVPDVLVEVNVAREPGKSGVDPGELDRFVERLREAGATVAGLMTMPPLAGDPEGSRRWFAALRELAAARGLKELSMGTTQDYVVAASEGATIVRIGTRLLR